MNTPRPFIRIATLLTGLVLASSGLAQSGNDGPLRFDFNLAAGHQSEVDLEDGARFQMDRWFANAGITYAWDRRHSLGLTVGTGSSSFEFASDPGSAPAWAWRDIEEMRVSMTGRFKISQRVSGFMIPSIRKTGERGARSSDSQTWGLYGAAAWYINDGLTIGPGFGVFSRLDRSTQAFPVLLIDWDITERWNLSTGGGLAASRGPGLLLSYSVSDYWRFGLLGRYEDFEFRLGPEGPAPGGVGRQQSLPIVLTAELIPGDHGSVSIFLGAEFGGELTLRDKDRTTIRSTEYDPALVAGVTLSIKF